jgi:tRNA A-37 threonylcarbamoyl transferase component Bud32/ribosomal protein L40E
LFARQRGEVRRMFFSDRYCISCGAVNPPEAEVCFACGLSLKITAPLLQEATINGQHLLQQRYRILSQVGKGGFSAVYQAQDTLFDDHLVAIKAITLSGLRPQEIIEATEAFNREITLLSGLKHPNLPRIYNHFSSSECWYLVMDYIEGITLENHLETMSETRLPSGEVLEIGIMLSTVLEYLHSRQPVIIFRDLKPANVILRSGGGIALIDFGIARHFKPGQARDTIPFGSPGYAAPEQYGKAQTTPQTDIYGLGALLHHLLTGDDPSQTPFRFASLHEEDQPVLCDLEKLIQQMVQMDAEKRPESITVVKEELQRIAQRWSTQHRRGLQAQGLPGLQPPDAVMGTGTAVSTAAGAMRMGKMAQLGGSAPGTGSSSSAYWGPTAQKKGNPMAVASVSLAILSIALPLSSCVGTSFLGYYFGIGSFSPAFFLPVLVTLVPSILAVIFGHIGKRRAMAVPGLSGTKDIAAAGMAIGYIFGSIYLVFCFLILFYFL